MKNGGLNECELRGMLDCYYAALDAEPAIKPETKARMRKLIKACTLHTTALTDEGDFMLPVYSMEDHTCMGSAVTDRRSHVMAAVPVIMDHKPVETAPSVVLLNIADRSTVFHEFSHLLSLQPYSKAGEAQYTRKWGVREDVFRAEGEGQMTCIASQYTCMNELLTDYCAEEMMRRCGFDEVYRKRKVRSAGYMDFCEAIALLGVDQGTLLSLYFNGHDEASRRTMDILLGLPCCGKR